MDNKIIDSLDVYGKLKIYFHYYAVQVALKYSFQVVDKAPVKPLLHGKKEILWTEGRGKPDKEFENIALYYLWKDLKALSFDEFQKERIYDWYWRFADEINHK
jgi:hypothetical protein